MRAIYWNRQRERGLGREIRNWDPRLLRAPRSKVNLVPPRDGEESRALLHRITSDLFRIGDKVATDRSPLVVFFHDEPDKEAPANDKESGAYEMAVRGNRHGVKLVSITQRASQHSLSVRANATTWILFSTSSEETVFLRRAGVPEDVLRWTAWDMVDGRAKPSYRFAVDAGAGWIKCDPIKA